MAILFPAEPFQPRRVDPDYARERTAAAEAGLDTFLIDFEALRWLIIEVGDGQVSGLADSVDVARFYRELARSLA